MKINRFRFPALARILILILLASAALQTASAQPASLGPPLQISIVGTNVEVSWPAVTNVFGVQHTTNLSGTNWSVLAATALVSNRYVVTEPLGGPARYYRLINPCTGIVAPPTLAPVPQLGHTSTRHIIYRLFDPDLGVIPSPVNPGLPVGMNVVGNATNILDATGFVDPASCVPGTLDYHWVIVYQADTGEVVNPYTAKGVKGYRTPVLRITPDSMPPGIGSIRLDVTSRITGLTTSVIFNIEIDISTQLVISTYLQCQLCALNPINCQCLIDAALPADEPT